MRRHHFTVACLALCLGGCSTFMPDKEQPGKRVPANPPDFKATTVGAADTEQGFRVERAAMMATIAELRGEVRELQLLFRLKTMRLEGEPEATATVGIPTAMVDAQPSPITAAPSARSQSPIVHPTAIAHGPAPGATPHLVAAEPVPAAKVDAPVLTPKPASTYTALFRFGSTLLDETAVAALEALRPQLVAAQRVQVNAFADKSGPQAANVKVAAARARAVQAQLLRLGVARERISVTSAVADTRPAQGVTLLGLFRAPDATGRRVDVALYQTAIR